MTKPRRNLAIFRSQLHLFRHWDFTPTQIHLIARNANEVACVVAEHSRAAVRDDASDLECVAAYLRKTRMTQLE
jgi:hypothetical protein